MITFKMLEKMMEDECRVHLPFNLNDVVYPCSNFTKESIFGAAHTGELRNTHEKAKKERGFLISDLI